ncbi:MAG TPA: hypothetical protein DGD08_18190 [Gemmatimonas aurantiaca]|uniref:MAE-28990/MAE-18760-like HEPN domain-containing protein n=2 Tax=Gemmatimonas aurantiaca TaxID=173480 RepID=C1AE42_GEMAT|nr:hypothetical protein [Gemmatimonas aurantiaca]BAH40769.1 hypothetical protein GAU_3727 [Gemmatimonas aurantiaca T-27]HCT59136.1 hypothetical protein [Gemmatimonas aurantiaca]
MVRFSYDARFSENEYDLWALGEYLDRLEAQLVTLRTSDEARTFAELSAEGLLDDEESRTIAWQGLEERADRVYPRLLRGPFLVALWGCYEATILNVAESIATERKLSLQHRDIRGESAVARARKYFVDYLDIALDKDPIREMRINDLYVLRNALAHANGLVSANSDDGKRRIEAIVGRNPTIELNGGFIVPSAEYLRSAFDDVDSSARDLVQRVRGGPAFRYEEGT